MEMSIEEEVKSVPQIVSLRLEPKIKEINFQEAKFRPPSIFAKINKHERDEHLIVIEVPHVYLWKNEMRRIISVSQLIEAFFPHFNGRQVSEAMVKRRNYLARTLDPKDRYFGCDTPDKITANWNRAIELGTLLHANIEDYLNERVPNILKENETCFHQFLLAHRIHRTLREGVYRTEYGLFDEDAEIAGTIDCLCRDTDYKEGSNNYVILDWKRVEEKIDDTSFNDETGYSICREVRNSKLMKYTLQLNCYKYILENKYGFKITRMYLVQFQPSRSVDLGPWMIEIKDMQPLVKKLFEFRMLWLKQKMLQ